MAPINNTPTGSAEFRDASIVAGALFAYLAQEREVPDVVPAGLDDALARAPDNPVENVLLQNGFRTWLAYHMATQTGTGNMVRAAASRLSLYGLATMASMIEAWARVDESVALFASRLFRVLDHWEWRVGVLKSIGVDLPPARYEHEYEYRYKPRPSRTQPPANHSQPATLYSHISPHPPQQRTRQSGNAESIRATQCEGEPGTRRGFSSFPLKKNLPKVFPPALLDDICSKGDRRAALTISNTIPDYCEMAIDIVPKAVPTLAALLYGAKINTSAMAVSVPVSGAGSYMEIKNCGTLKLSPIESIRAHLGCFISKKLGEGRLRLLDIENGSLEATDLVSLDISGREDSPGRLKIVLGFAQMLEVRARLFPGD
ncbi:hypothetical protein CMQ_1776 [Grosmannia clavigera kw1407]|uniref:Uncharacterized protein n=1 Tax=Grosmannia clavigera (strain kw1407 / UAMH 11150) TaxID=655863 RepID=F0XAY8_GROCL|nr:uncharacterized protein CMQ_1776 [Grosmannia clavigera kw1407]EFX05140.1 hypothetical protein CMQ_1776 [Grosmannia clavigera kw1407]